VREQPAASERSDLGFSRALVLLTVAGLVIRLAVLLLEPRCPPTGDEPAWLALGLSELGRPHRGLSPLRNRFIFYPPLYPYFIAIAHRIFGSLAGVLGLQAAVGALLVPAVARAGRSAFGPKVGLVAGALAAFYPDFVWFSVHAWSETLFTVALWWGIERTLHADENGSSRTAVAAGVFFALAALTRELALYLAPLAVLWLARGRLLGRPSQPRPGGPARAALLVCGLLLTIAPWTVRNAIVYHAFVPISTMGASNLYQGNVPITHIQVHQRLAAASDPIERDRLARRLAWQAIRDQQPWWILHKLRGQMPEFWKLDSEIVDQIVSRRACGRPSRRTAFLLEALTVPPYASILLLSLVGLARLRVTPGAVLLVGLLAAHNFAHVVALATPRYRLPLLPVVFLLAALAVAAPREGVRAPLRGWRISLLLVLVALATLVISWNLDELLIWSL
jgi:hypothetical protein